jgi:hypothetical protein
MVGITRKAAATLTFVFFCAQLTGAAHAELLQRLHVDDFKMAADTRHPEVGVPFHVTLTVHVREPITRLQYLSLPTFFGLESLGERHRVARSRNGGSIYQETLTLVARTPGPTAIGSAYLDAVDLRDSKTKRFISNNLILNVIGKPLPNPRATAGAMLLGILALLLLAAGLFIAWKVYRRKRPAVTAFETAPRTEKAPPVPLIGLDEALARLRTRRDRSSVLRVREALWSAAGANPGETLGDVLQREGAHGDGLGRMLVAFECAAFVNDTRLQQAIDDALCEAESTVAR